MVTGQTAKTEIPTTASMVSNPTDRVDLKLIGFEVTTRKSPVSKRWGVEINGDALVYDEKQGIAVLTLSEEVAEHQVLLEFSAARTAILEAVSFLHRWAKREAMQKIDSIRKLGVI